MEERIGQSMYLNHEVNKAFTLYCKKSDKPKYFHVEKALTEKMRNNPIDGVTITVPPNPDFEALVSMVVHKIQEDRLTDV